MGSSLNVVCFFTKHIKTLGKGASLSSVFRIFALIIQTLYDLRRYESTID